MTPGPGPGSGLLIFHRCTVFLKKIRTPHDKMLVFRSRLILFEKGEGGDIYLLELDGEHLDKMAEIKHSRLLTEYFLMMLFLQLF